MGCGGEGSSLRPARRQGLRGSQGGWSKARQTLRPACPCPTGPPSFAGCPPPPSAETAGGRPSQSRLACPACLSTPHPPFQLPQRVWSPCGLPCHHIPRDPAQSHTLTRGHFGVPWPAGLSLLLHKPCLSPLPPSPSSRVTSECPSPSPGAPGLVPTHPWAPLCRLPLSLSLRPRHLCPGSCPSSVQNPTGPMHPALGRDRPACVRALSRPRAHTVPVTSRRCCVWASPPARLPAAPGWGGTRP